MFYRTFNKNSLKTKYTNFLGKNQFSQFSSICSNIFEPNQDSSPKIFLLLELCNPEFLSPWTLKRTTPLVNGQYRHKRVAYIKESSLLADKNRTHDVRSYRYMSQRRRDVHVTCFLYSTFVRFHAARTQIFRTPPTLLIHPRTSERRPQSSR